MLLPIIMILVCVLLGGGTLLFLKFSERRKKAKSRDKEELAQMTANEFVNVKDIRGSFLYTRDGMALAYLKIFPISTELFSKNEKRLIAKQLTVSLSSGQYPFQLLAVSRPVDISPLMAELSSTLTASSNIKQKELLKHEIVEMGGFALSGEVVERQFYIKIWDKAVDGVERELLQKLKYLSGYFADCGIQTEILEQQDIVRLCNLVNNPAYYFAKDSSGGLVILDPWTRGNDRTNSSFVVMGVAGIGKSTVVKHIMLSEYMKGTKILCIDPESEYKDMCRNLGGNWLNAGGGRNGRSNLLQIRPAPRDDEDETDKLYTDEGNGMSDMALHIKTLEIIFSLYLPSLSDMQKAVLKQTVIELYNQFGIFWDTDIRQLKATDFPIMEDLHSLIEKKAEANPDNPVFRDLAMLLYDAAKGSDSFLWNGHSTLEADSHFVCLDTHSLQNAADNIKRTQYFNLLTWCWEQMSNNRGERVLLVCDEAYLMIDPQVPQSLAFLRNVEKRSRKYESALAIISHSVVDFLAPEIKMYGQALLDIPCYKILMGCDGKNLQETTDLYNLTDAEQELLESKRRGHALFLVGSKRLHVNFEIPAYKFAYMGKAGGR